MANFPPASAGTVPVAAAAPPHDSSDDRTVAAVTTVAAMQGFFEAALASLRQGREAPATAQTDADVPVASASAAAPALPPAPAVTAPVTAPAPAIATGFLTHGPWVCGSLYVVVPAGPLLPLAHNADDEATWYCVTKGHYVGVTLSNPLALAAVSGVSGSGMKGYKDQALAVAAFNEMLSFGLVKVIV